MTGPATSEVVRTGFSARGPASAVASSSTALAELARRGFPVVETDDAPWSEWHPATDGAKGEWLWREDEISALLASENESTLYVSGCVSNQGKFYDRFDAVVLLSAPVEVMLERIESRTTNDYGKGPAERDRILADFAYAEPLLRATCTHELDTSAPIDEVVGALIAIGQERRANA